jgi:serine protease Do
VRGEVIGINAAISSRAANIGFAVPINHGQRHPAAAARQGSRVARLYRVALRDVDPDLQRSLGLKGVSGALVQDVTPGSPGARAGLRTYDLILAVDGKPGLATTSLIELIASRSPGTTADAAGAGATTFAERPGEAGERPCATRPPDDRDERPQPSSPRGPALGLSVREIDRDFADRYQLPDGMQGVIIARVEPMSPAFDADIERNSCCSRSTGTRCARSTSTAR